MCQQFQTIRSQVRFYSSSDDEQWKIDHEQAMVCRELEATISLGLTILENVRRSHAQWMKDVDGGHEFSEDWGKLFASLFREWLDKSRIVWRAVQALTKHGYKIEQAEEFRKACHDVALLPLDVDRVRESIASLEAGRGKTQAQVLDELRGRLRRARA